MQTKQRDILNTLNNIDETHSNNSTLITHEPIEGTPFTITGTEEKGYFLRIGDYRLTNYHTDRGKVLDELNNEYWNIIVKLLGVVIAKTTEEQNVKTTQHITEK